MTGATTTTVSVIDKIRYAPRVRGIVSERKLALIQGTKTCVMSSV